MSNHEERMKILEMIANGTVTAEEGARLLEAVQAGPAAESTAEATPAEAPGPVEVLPGVPDRPANGNGRRLRIKVIEQSGTRVNINLPLSLMEVGLKIGGRFVDELQDMDNEMQMLLDAMRHDVTGKIVEVDDEDSHVEIFIE